MLIRRTLERTAARWPDREAVVDGDHRMTYREWNRAVDRVAGSLHTLGIEAGTRVGMFTHNCFEQVTTYLAAAALGAIAVPLNHRLAPGELSFLMNASESELLVYDPDLLTVVESARSDIATNPNFVSTGTGELGHSFTDLLNGEELTQRGDPNPDGTSVMMHTSGTTGRPKLVELTPRGQWINSLSCAVELDYSAADRALNMAPLYHSAGYLNLFLPVMHVGGTNVIMRSFDPVEALEIIDRERITTTLGVPTQYHRFQQVDAARSPDTLRLATVSGAQFGQDVVEWVTTNLCTRFVNVYGLTESTGFVTILHATDLNRMEGGFCIGKPFLNMDVRLVEIGDNVPPDATIQEGERGQLITRGEKVMRGYYGRPDATSEALVDGWLYTGDVAVNRDGYYYLVDRVDNMIISGGENIYPAEIERALNEHPQIEQSAVVGEADSDLGERVVAHVKRGDQSLTPGEIESYWRSRDDIADFKRPRKITFVDDIPKNPSGKIVRHELTE